MAGKRNAVFGVGLSLFALSLSVMLPVGPALPGAKVEVLVGQLRVYNPDDPNLPFHPCLGTPDSVEAQVVATTIDGLTSYQLEFAQVLGAVGNLALSTGAVQSLGPNGLLDTSDCGFLFVDGFEFLGFSCGGLLGNSGFEAIVSAGGFRFWFREMRAEHCGQASVPQVTDPLIRLDSGTAIQEVAATPNLGSGSETVAWAGTLQVTYVTGSSSLVAGVGLQNPPCDAFQPGTNPLITSCVANPLFCCTPLTVPVPTVDELQPLACLRHATVRVDLNGDGTDEFSEPNALTVVPGQCT